MTPIYFATPAEFRAWLEENHTKAEFLLVGFYKKGTGQPSMTWPESASGFPNGRAGVPRSGCSIARSLFQAHQ
jgi:hypothetical protein